VHSAAGPGRRRCAEMPKASSCALLLLLLGAAALGQAPQGPQTPPPRTHVQQTPPQAPPKLTAKVTPLTTPVTVRDSRGAMIHDLDREDFLVRDNGIDQKITHFEVGGDPLSVAVVVETSSRIEPLLPQIRKLGIVFTEQLLGPDGEAAVVGF